MNLVKGAKPVDTEFKSYVVRIIVDELNIRTGPSTSYEKVGELYKGDAYTIIEEKITGVNLNLEPVGFH